MHPSTAKVILLLLVTVVGWVGLWLYESRSTAAARHAQPAFETEQRTQRLAAIAKRLQVPRRVARVIVTDRKSDNEHAVVTEHEGNVRTTVLWIEYAADQGRLLPAQRLVFEGRSARVQARVIQFDGDHAREHEALRGLSLMLFTAVQPGGAGAGKDVPLDPAGGIPEFYKPADPRQAETERPFWQDFWKLADDPQYRAARGVRVLELQASVPPEGFRKGYIYTVTLGADGTLNVQREPIDPQTQKAIEAGAKPRD